jgi:hypothetical protein
VPKLAALAQLKARCKDLQTNLLSLAMDVVAPKRRCPGTQVVESLLIAYAENKNI